MKKLLLGGVALLALAAASCSGHSDMGTPTNDSLSQALGQFQGLSHAMANAQYTDEERRQYLDAFEEVFAQANTEAGFEGAVSAAQLLTQIESAKQAGIIIDRATVLQAFKDAYTGGETNEDAVMRAHEAFAEQVNNAVRTAHPSAHIAGPSSPQDQAYLASLKEQDPSLVTTHSGLVYKIENPGEGTRPNAHSTVAVKYTGYHIDGSQFDSSGDQAVTFNLQGVIPGFAEGLKLLAPGGKARLYIPGNIAYGPEGTRDGTIGPNETLIFDVELVSVQN